MTSEHIKKLKNSLHLLTQILYVFARSRFINNNKNLNFSYLISKGTEKKTDLIQPQGEPYLFYDPFNAHIDIV